MKSATREAAQDARPHSGRDVIDGATKRRRHEATKGGADHQLIKSIREELAKLELSCEQLLVRPIEALLMALRIDEGIDDGTRHDLVVQMRAMRNDRPAAIARLNRILGVMLNARKNGKLKHEPLQREIPARAQKEKPSPRRIMRSNGEALSLRQRDRAGEAEEALPTPEKPDGQSLTWHQWARLLGSMLHRTVQPTGEFLELYLRGLKPSAAVKSLRAMEAKDPLDGEPFDREFDRELNESKSEPPAAPKLSAAQINLLCRLAGGRVIRWVSNSHGGSFRECWPSDIRSGALGDPIPDSNLKERSVRLLTGAGLIQKIVASDIERWEITDAGRAWLEARVGRMR